MKIFGQLLICTSVAVILTLVAVSHTYAGPPVPLPERAMAPGFTIVFSSTRTGCNEACLPGRPFLPVFPLQTGYRNLYSGLQTGTPQQDRSGIL